MSYTDLSCNNNEAEWDISSIECKDGDAGIPVSCAAAPTYDSDKELSYNIFGDTKCGGASSSGSAKPKKCYSSSGSGDTLIAAMTGLQAELAGKFSYGHKASGRMLMTDCVRAALPLLSTSSRPCVVGYSPHATPPGQGHVCDCRLQQGRLQQ